MKKKNGLSLKIKFFQTTLVLLVALTVFSVSFAQYKSDRPIRLENTTSETITIPKDVFIDKKIYFFNYKLSIAEPQLLITLYDEKKAKNAEISIKENKIDKSYEFEITVGEESSESIKITSVNVGNTETFKALSSSGETLEISVVKSAKLNNECSLKTPISELRVIGRENGV
jgi:hypothetical protein